MCLSCQRDACADQAGRAFLRNEWDERSLIATGSCMTSVAIHCLCSFVFYSTRTHARTYTWTYKAVFFPDECSHRGPVLKEDNPLEQGRGGLHGCWAQSHSQGSSQSGGRKGWRRKRGREWKTEEERERKRLKWSEGVLFQISPDPQGSSILVASSTQINLFSIKRKHSDHSGVLSNTEHAETRFSKK